MSSIALNISNLFCDSVFERSLVEIIFSELRRKYFQTFPFTMRSLLFFSTFLLAFYGSRSDFAAQLAAFINDTVSIKRSFRSGSFEAGHLSFHKLIKK